MSVQQCPGTRSRMHSQYVSAQYYCLQQVDVLEMFHLLRDNNERFNKKSTLLKWINETDIKSLDMML